MNEAFELSRSPSCPAKPVQVQRIHPSVIDIVQSMVPLGCYVVGGYARWACSEREDSPKPTDVDVAALTEGAFQEAKKAFKLDGASVAKDTEFSITYAAYTAYGCPFEVQLLKNYKHGTIEGLLSHIDFSVCRVALVDQYSGWADPRYKNHEREGRLSVLHIDTKSINNVVCRMLRYAQKGYDISQLDVLNVLRKVKECDLDDPGLVESENLTYRDVAS